MLPSNTWLRATRASHGSAALSRGILTSTTARGACRAEGSQVVLEQIQRFWVLAHEVGVVIDDLPLEGAPDDVRASVGDQIGDRASGTRDGDGLARLYALQQFGEVRLCLVDVHGDHGLIIAI